MSACARGSFVVSMLGGLILCALLCFLAAIGDSEGSGKLVLILIVFLPAVIGIALALAVLAYWGIVYPVHLLYPVCTSRSAKPFFAGVLAASFLWGAGIGLALNGRGGWELIGCGGIGIPLGEDIENRPRPAD